MSGGLHSTAQYPTNIYTRGGALIGEGVYGCAFTPPLKCRGKQKNPINLVKRRVGKLTNDYDAYWETTITERLAQQPLAKNYFILIEETCIPDKRNEQDEAELSECKVIQGRKIKSFKQITMPYGGISLTMAQINMAKFDIMSFTQHLLEAGALLLLSGIVHSDLHTSNIVLDEFQVPRLIDFGMAIIPETLDKNSFEFLRRQPDFQFNQEPPEMSYFWAAAAGVTDAETPYDIVNDKKIFKDIQGHRSPATEIEIFVSKSKAIQQKDGISLIKTYWPQYDAWSIGVVLVQLLRSLTMYREFQQNPTYANNKEVLEKVLRGLTEASPMKRMDAIEALSVLMAGAGAESFVLTDLAGEWLKQRRQQRASL
jgi:serine/threonine protein kinase